MYIKSYIQQLLGIKHFKRIHYRNIYIYYIIYESDI